MENNSKSIAILAGSIVIVLMLAGIIFTSVLVSKGKKNLNAEKLTSEKILSEKLSVEKELSKIKSEYSLLNDKFEAIQKTLAESNQKVTENENRIRTITAENRSLREKSAQLDELNRQKANLEKEVERIKAEYDNLSAQNRKLQNTISALETEKSNLAQQIEESRKILTDNFLVTAIRGKKTEKIVIAASRTKKLNIAFEVPNDLTTGISFSIVTPSGQVITPDDKSLSWYFPLDYRSLTASISPLTGEFVQSRQVVLNYVPKSKLQKGEYKIQILDNGKNIGNCRMTLK